jgi:quercetin dioxygenase-like cupin family protein
MKRTLTTLILSAAFFAAGTAGAEQPATKSSRTPVANLKWFKPMGEQGPELSIVYGDPQKGPFGTFLKLQPGQSSGWHTHDSDYTAVVVQGTHNHLSQGEKATAGALPQGSWWSRAAKENHLDQCSKDGPACVIFIHMNGPMTFHAKTADGKDVPPANDAKPAKK